MSLGVSLPYISLIEPYIPLLHLQQANERFQPERSPNVARSAIMWSGQKANRSLGGGGTHWGLQGQNQDRSGLRLRSGFDCRPFGRAGVGITAGSHLMPIPPLWVHRELLIALQWMRGSECNLVKMRSG